MGKHEDRDKAEQQRKIDSNGHDPNRPLPDKDPGGKHGKDDDKKDDTE